MRKGRFVVKFLIFLIVFFFAIAVYYSTLNSYCLVDESVWALTSVKSRMLSLKLRFFLKGIRLRHITLDVSEIVEKQSLEYALNSIPESEIVVLDPVISYACNTLEIDAASILKNACVTAIASDNSKGYFDCILISEKESAWENLSYDETITGNEDIIICKNSDDITSYMNNPDFNKSFIVDFRYASAVPQGKLYGVIEPRLEDAFAVQSGDAKLRYEFRKTQRKIF